MAGNHFGNLFKIVTWGESHGKAVGVVIDGCPAGLSLSSEDINRELALRRPGHEPYTSPRREPDVAEILSGLFEGKTTGTPISLIIWNCDVKPSAYAPIKDVLRPGHANFTYLKKYGVFDWRGGGRASARETAARVAAGAVAKKLLAHEGIELFAFVQAVGSSTQERPRERTLSPGMQAVLEEVLAAKDSIGGVVELTSTPLPSGLGAPVFAKLEADLARAMLSIPASKGIECGEGMRAAALRGSVHNDTFTLDEAGEPKLATNRAGGTLGGISCGTPLVLRVAFKPPSSIGTPQQSVTCDGHAMEMTLPEDSRHDPCVALRAVSVVEAMAALVLADHLLLNRISKLTEVLS